MLSPFRQQILRAQAQTKLEHIEVPHALSGPSGETLYTDYFFTTEKKENCLVHLSGVHGVEGYLGSLIQQEILKQNLENLPFQLILVHAVNPFGMATSSRTNAANVDLNRNTLVNYHIENSHFHHFLPFLKSGKILDFAKTLPTILRIGLDQSIRAVACGQTEYPDSLFFCGKERQPELISLKSNLERLIDKQSKVFALDVHTGLGKLGTESLIVQGFNSQDEAAFETIFQKKLTVPDRDSGFYSAQGSLADLFQESWQSWHFFQEFGTRPFYKILRALIHPNPADMNDAFFPDIPSWREHCVELGLLRFQQLTQGL